MVSRRTLFTLLHILETEWVLPSFRTSDGFERTRRSTKPSYSFHPHLSILKDARKGPLGSPRRDRAVSRTRILSRVTTVESLFIVQIRFPRLIETYHRRCHRLSLLESCMAVDPSLLHPNLARTCLSYL